MAGDLHEPERKSSRYDSWQSRNDPGLSRRLSGQRETVPDGAKMAKIHWTPKPNEFFPNATVPGALLNVDFMVKDSKRFADSGGWGYAVFEFDASSGTFKPGTLASTPPQGNDARCGFTCHTLVKKNDYVFTEFGKR